MDNVFVFPVRVYYEDTDADGIVYYVNYLKFAERARTEYLINLHISQQELLDNDKTCFVVRSCHIEYLSSAVLGDSLVVACRIKEFGGASVVMEQKIYRGDDVLITMEVKLIYISTVTHRPTRIPPQLKEKMGLQ
ncbi:MAG: tol-pal system-associated acyl-CoA thioesterase [Alphaproteobacteria bacterium]|nr:tol-pal system-associated acyl-CoA thioesterase [Alphaproteobacteria bacterium]